MNIGSFGVYMIAGAIAIIAIVAIIYYLYELIIKIGEKMGQLLIGKLVFSELIILAWHTEYLAAEK